MVCHCIYFTEACRRKFFKSVAWCFLDIMYTRLLGVDVHINGQGSGFFPHASPIWTSSVATHLNLRIHLLAIRISGKIKCLIRYDFSTFTWGLEYFDHKQWIVFSKPSSGKKNRCIFFPLFSNLRSGVFFLREREKMKYQASFSPSLQTKIEEGPPDRRLTIFTILNNLNCFHFELRQGSPTAPYSI